MAAAERPWWAYNSTGHDVPIETFLLPPHSVSVNPGIEGGSVGWKSPIAGTVRVTGRLTDARSPRRRRRRLGDRPRHPPGAARARRRACSPTEARSGSIRAGSPAAWKRSGSSPATSSSFRSRWRKGDAHYDITNVELTISSRDRSAEWDLARDVGDGFPGGQPARATRGDTPASGDSTTWPGATARRGCRRSTACWPTGTRRPPPVPGAGSRLEATARGLAKRSRGRPERRPRPGPDRRPEPLLGQGPGRSPLPLPGGQGRAPGTLAASSRPRRAQVPSLSYASGIQEGGLRYGPYPGIQDARIYIRGSYAQPGRRVPRHFPEVLAGRQPAPDRHGQRPAGAGALDRPARQPADRPGDGQPDLAAPLRRGDRPHAEQLRPLGEPPTHPELLDWLARRFVESGWSVKAMHRLIMLSAAYQRSSQAPAELLEADPENRLWGRMNRRRLEAEALHDSLLALAGRLDDQPGGPADVRCRQPAPAALPEDIALGPLGFRVALRSGQSGAARRAADGLDRRAPGALPDESSLGHSSRRAAWRTAPRSPPSPIPPRRIALLHRLIFGRPATDEEIAAGPRLHRRPRRQRTGPPELALGPRTRRRCC